jgi:SAM-dependent methyltransferase
MSSNQQLRHFPFVPRLEALPHDEAFYSWKSEQARRAFDAAYVRLFDDVAEHLRLTPAALFSLCARGPHLVAQAWNEAMSRGVGIEAAYRQHMDMYFYDLLMFNGIAQAGRPRSAAVLENAAALADGPVADFGSGLGSLALFFSVMGLDVTSLEINESLKDFQRWRFAKHGQPAPRFEPHPDGSYSVLFCTDVIEHLEDPKAWVPYAYRLLKPGGHLLLTHYFCKTGSGGEYPMHLDDLDEIHGFLDAMERHFEPDPAHRTFDNFVSWKKRPVPVEPQTPAAFVAPTSEEDWQRARPYLPAGVSLNQQAGPDDQRQYFLHKPGEYFRKPAPIDRASYEFLQTMAGTPPQQLRESLRALTHKRLLGWRR